MIPILGILGIVAGGILLGNPKKAPKRRKPRANRNPKMETVNGYPVNSHRVFKEGNYWRWEIITDRGTYVDGGNYATRDEAKTGLKKSYDPRANRNPGTLDLTPSPTKYRQMLQVVIDHSTKKADRIWASQEMTRVKDVTKWGKQNPDKNYHLDRMSSIDETYPIPRSL